MTLEDFARAGLAADEVFKLASIGFNITSATDSRDRWWWYEHPNYITLVHEIWHNGVYVRTDQATIRKAALRRYLERVGD